MVLKVYWWDLQNQTTNAVNLEEIPNFALPTCGPTITEIL